MLDLDSSLRSILIPSSEKENYSGNFKFSVEINKEKPQIIFYLNTAFFFSPKHLRSQSKMNSKKFERRIEKVLDLYNPKRVFAEPIRSDYTNSTYRNSYLRYNVDENKINEIIGLCLLTKESK